ncbi:hypothetical protein BJV78DRAFT_1242025 [Lactifluus subvellereus]|nr:hypothetical protein BJV78DRAFT_1242025 [Lactifluus subvellereus]
MRDVRARTASRATRSCTAMCCGSGSGRASSAAPTRLNRSAPSASPPLFGGDLSRTYSVLANVQGARARIAGTRSLVATRPRTRSSAEVVSSCVSGWMGSRSMGSACCHSSLAAFEESIYARCRARTAVRRTCGRAHAMPFSASWRVGSSGASDTGGEMARTRRACKASIHLNVAATTRAALGGEVGLMAATAEATSSACSEEKRVLFARGKDLDSSTRVQCAYSKLALGMFEEERTAAGGNDVLEPCS